MRAARGATALSGVLAIDKPAGMTSHDVVAALRRATGERRIGHAGTLDPLATGLLLVLVGSAARLGRYLSGQDKTYDAHIVLGTATDTLDADGVATGHAPVPETALDPEAARRILDSFLGSAEQVPPAYSAIKRGGVTAHRAARSGSPIELEPRPIVVSEALLGAISADPPAWDVTFTVSKGTYVRSLARDVGTAVGTCAHLGALRRTRIASLTLDAALTLDRAVDAAAAGSLAREFIDPVPLLGFPALSADPVAVSAGRAVPQPSSPMTDGSPVALVTDETLAAVYRASRDWLVAETVFSPGVTR